MARIRVHAPADAPFLSAERFYTHGTRWILDPLLLYRSYVRFCAARLLLTGNMPRNRVSDIVPYRRDKLLLYFAFILSERLDLTLIVVKLLGT